MSPRSNRLLAAASNGHGPLVDCNKIRTDCPSKRMVLVAYVSLWSSSWGVLMDELLVLFISVPAGGLTPGMVTIVGLGSSRGAEEEMEVAMVL